jgi:predicted outer membrane protein
MATAFRGTLGALVVVWMPALALAQQNPAQPRTQVQPGQRVLQNQPAQPGQPAQQRTTLKAIPGRQGESVADHEAATWLLLSNEVEVALAQMAQKQAHGGDVKKFAEMMIEQHGDLINQLRQFAADAPTLTNRQRDTNRDTNREAQRDANRDNDRVAAAQAKPAQPGQPRERQGAEGGLPIDQICYQMAERTLNSMERELARKQGSDFDKGYIGCQIHEHMVMVDTLEILKPYASAQLQAVIDQAIPHAQQHLAQARKIGEQLWGSGVEQRTTGGREDRDDKNRQDK